MSDRGNADPADDKNASPAITFRVDLSLLQQETFGPMTNSREMTMHHPDMFQTSPDQGQEDLAYRKYSTVTWLPGNMPGPNFELKHGATFTAYGTQATYLKKNYVYGQTGVTRDRGVLVIVTEE